MKWRILDVFLKGILGWLLLILLITGCGGKNLSTVWKEDLTMLPIIETPGGFQVSKQREEFDETRVDAPIFKFIACYNASQTTPFPLKTLKTYRFYLLTQAWECPFTTTFCAGEFDRASRSIWIAYLFVNLGVTEHELAHMSGLINKNEKVAHNKARASRHCFDPL